MPSKIKIHQDSETKEPITYEEIQNEKKTQFESEFTKRQEEFTSAMSLPTPEAPDFSDKFIDQPISEMDKIIKEMTEKRNYDVEQITRTHQTTIENADNWLKPQKTSIKSEKYLPPPQPNNNKLKYLNNDQEKNVTWGQNEEFYISDEEQDIFKKLKKVPSNLENITISMNEVENNPKSIEDRLTYIEQTIDTYSIKIDQILTMLQNKL